jgi:prepilin-type N-terminal cleavage/methylation domain-containing protein
MRDDCRRVGLRSWVLGLRVSNLSPKTKDLRPLRPGFTLVELLVVITIIGILIALLLPAVQAAREAARRAQCTNNLKQIALAMLGHEQVHSFFPSGGWNWEWCGDPDRDTGREQPGNWVFALLPFLEQQALHDLGADGDPDHWTARQKAGAAQRSQTPLAMFQCPTRRPCQVYVVAPWSGVPCFDPQGNYTAYGSDPANRVARSDYAANAGDQPVNWVYGIRTTLPPPDHSFPWPNAENGPVAGQWGTGPATGICYFRSQVAMRDIVDGASNTYLLGEKYLTTDFYENGWDHADNESMYCGFDNDTHRLTYNNATYLPQQDTPGAENYYCFGSAHATSYNAAMCDGSVRPINYTIDVETHRRLGNRKDGMTIDDKKF